MSELNPYILCAMDKSKTPEELRKNRAAAYAAYAYVDAYDAADAYAAEYWLIRYFEHTGENREDYENEINKEANK